MGVNPYTSPIAIEPLPPWGKSINTNWVDAGMVSYPGWSLFGWMVDSWMEGELILMH